MRKTFFKALAVSSATAIVLSSGATFAQQATLNDIFSLSARGNRVAQTSQERIDQLSNQTQDLLQQYKTLLKEIEGLRIYNAQVERSIQRQVKVMDDLRASIEDVALIKRQITPLVDRMVDALEEFISLDMPFLLEERQARVDRLNEIMDDPDISASEKFRVVFEAYQIENEYGRTNWSGTGSLTLDGLDYEGTFLRVGRVGLYFQNGDASLSAFWDPTDRQWKRLDSDYDAAIRQGIQITKGQVQPDLIRIPVVKPQAEG